MNPDELMAQSVSEFVISARVFAPTDRVAEVIGFMKESGSFEAIIEESDKTSIVTMRDLLDVSSLETHSPS